MLIWFNLLIPVIAILFLLFRFKRKMALWEYALLFVIPVIVIAIAKFSSVSSQTKDHEIWNMYITSAQYTEPWTTWVTETCSRENCTGSGEDRTCTTEYYDCSYCDRNGPSWTAYDNSGKSYSITRVQFEMLCNKWGNRTFKDMRRSIDYSGGCGQDGDAYTTKWNGVFEDLVPITAKHSYKNKVQVSTSVFNFQAVDSIDKAELKLFEYPAADRWNYNPILGATDIAASERLRKWNGKLGSFRQVHMLICVFKNLPREAAERQEDYWKGGNKNEFILCLGIDDSKKVKWSHVISWTEEEKLKIEVRDEAMEIGYDLVKIVDYMATNVQKKFQRKEFADFNYLKIEPTSRAVMITFFITLILTIGLSIFFVMNEFTFHKPGGSGPTRRYR
jgi:hypothetical protein